MIHSVVACELALCYPGSVPQSNCQNNVVIFVVHYSYSYKDHLSKVFLRLLYCKQG